jgi:hypothetical protein
MAKGHTTAVWKYPLSLGPAVAWQEIEMPRAAGLVRVGQQGDVPTVWAIVNPHSPLETRRLIAVPTGFELLGHHAYVGSTEIEGGQIVVHVFEELPTIPDPPPAPSDEPLGTCTIHGDYWTDDCWRCGR